MVFEDGRQSRDLIHVFDVADAVVRAAEGTDVVHEALNVCTGRPITIAEVAQVLAERLGVELAPEVMGRYRAGDIRHCIGDPSRACAVLGFQARVSFADGLDELLAWSERQSAEDRVELSLARLEEQGLVR